MDVEPPSDDNRAVSEIPPKQRGRGFAIAWRQVLTLMREEPGLLARFVATNVSRMLTSVAVIFLVRDFLSGVLGERAGIAGRVADAWGATAALWVGAVLLVGAYLGGAWMHYKGQIIQQRLVKVIELSVMERLIRHLLTLSVPFFDRQSDGDLIQAIRSDVSQLRLATVSVANILVDGALVVGLAAAAAVLSPRLAFWGLLAVPLGCIPAVIVARRALAKSFTIRARGFVLFDAIQQILRGIRVIKVFRGEAQQAELSVERGRRYFDALIDMTRTSALSAVALESIAGLGVVVVIVFGGIDVMRGELGWPELLAFIMAVRALHGPLNSANYHYVRTREFNASVERIDELLATPPDVGSPPDAVRLDRPPSAIVFEDVDFDYAPADANTTVAALRGVSFTCHAGETVGIVGPSGAGKSTVLNLVARFYDPTEGRVRFGDFELSRIHLDDVYDRIAIVTQTPFLFATTVRENIRCGRPNADDAAVEEAAAAAYVHDEICALPQGYDTPLGIGAVGVSLGQAQRINVARALLKNAPVLLLDEATSSLDSVAERAVQRAIDRLVRHRTTLVVAHRLSTLRNAHRLVVLEEGRVVGDGSHESLLDECPLYAEMWRAQHESDDEPEGAGHGEPALTPHRIAENVRANRSE